MANTRPCQGASKTTSPFAAGGAASPSSRSSFRASSLSGIGASEHRDADHRLPRHQRGEGLLVQLPGARRPFRQNQVSHLGAGIPDPDFLSTPAPAGRTPRARGAVHGRCATGMQDPCTRWAAAPAAPTDSRNTACRPPRCAPWRNWRPPRVSALRRPESRRVRSPRCRPRAALHGSPRHTRPSPPHAHHSAVPPLSLNSASVSSTSASVSSPCSISSDSSASARRA